ncbi:MAG: adenosine kinase [Pseudomonadota bacterium]
MTSPTIDVLGIGNAIVDVLAQADDAFLETHGIEKNSMTLIDEGQADALYAAMGSGREISGGSVANSIAGVASFGGVGSFIGKVRDDQLGAVFAHDLRAVGVHFDTPFAKSGPATARSLINVTPDAHRSMSTFLGACVGLTPEDVDEPQVSSAQITYLEGYLFDKEDAKQAFRRAAEIAVGAGRKTAMTLSDSFCVERHRADFFDFITSSVDVLFANEAEIKAMYETEDFETALEKAPALAEIVAVTRSEKGSIILADGARIPVEAAPPPRLVDTTGAGDLYAAGFLFGLTRGDDAAHCAKLGSLAAAEIISHYGARPEVSLKDLAAENGL